MKFIILKRGNYNFAVKIEEIERIVERNKKGKNRLKDIPVENAGISILLRRGGRIDAECIKGLVDTDTVLEVASYISLNLPFVVVGAIEVENSLIPLVE